MAGELEGRTVLAVFAHPDDEALACGGTLARLADGGARVILVCASRGELGSVSDGTLVPDGDLARVRAEELEASAEVLGAAAVVHLSHPDGYLRWDEAAPFDDELLGLLERYRPAAVITFDADGLYWHADHIGVHERTTRAVDRAGASAPALYYVSLPQGAIRELAAAARARGAAMGTSLWGISPDAFGFATPRPTVRVDVRDWAARKLAALRCHRTQTGGPASPFTWIDETDARRCLGVELFRRADGAVGGMLESLGEPVEAQ